VRLYRVPSDEGTGARSGSIADCAVSLVNGYTLFDRRIERDCERIGFGGLRVERLLVRTKALCSIFST